MTEGLDLGSWRTDSMAFRLEIADFCAFYERTYDVAYRTALGIVRDPALAAEVTQEAYVAAYTVRDRFRGEAPSAAWLHRIVVNQALAALRRSAKPHPMGIAAQLPRDDASGMITRLTVYEAADGGWIYVNPRPGEAGRLVSAADIGIPGKIVVTTDGNAGWSSP